MAVGAQILFFAPSSQFKLSKNPKFNFEMFVEENDSHNIASNKISQEAVSLHRVTPHYVTAITYNPTFVLLSNVMSSLMCLKSVFMSGCIYCIVLQPKLFFFIYFFFLFTSIIFFMHK